MTEHSPKQGCLMAVHAWVVDCSEACCQAYYSAQTHTMCLKIRPGRSLFINYGFASHVEYMEIGWASSWAFRACLVTISLECRYGFVYPISCISYISREIHIRCLVSSNPTRLFCRVVLPFHLFELHISTISLMCLFDGPPSDWDFNSVVDFAVES